MSQNIPQGAQRYIGSTSRAFEDGKFYCPCRNCMGLNPRRILITSAKKNCKDYGHAKGEHAYHPFVNYLLCLCIVDYFCKCLYVY